VKVLISGGSPVDRKTLIISGAGIGLIILIIALIVYLQVQQGNNEAGKNYYQDPVTGEVLFNDPSQAAEDETSKRKSLTLLSNEELYKSLLLTQYNQLRVDLYIFMQQQGYKDVVIGYVSGVDVERNGIINFSLQPKDKQDIYRVTIDSSNADKITTTIPAKSFSKTSFVNE
jgi:hypothetical protein